MLQKRKNYLKIDCDHSIEETFGDLTSNTNIDKSVLNIDLDESNHIITHIKAIRESDTACLLFSSDFTASNDLTNYKTDNAIVVTNDT